MKTSTTIRLDTAMKKKVLALAKKYGLTFTDIVCIALGEILHRGAHITATEYPPGYIEELEKEAEETYRLYKEGKIKGYDNPKEAIDAMHREAQEYMSNEDNLDKKDN